MAQRNNTQQGKSSNVHGPVTVEEWNEFFPRNTEELRQFFIEQKKLVDAYNRSNPGSCPVAGSSSSADQYYQPASLAYLAASAAYAPLGFRTNPLPLIANGRRPTRQEVRNIALLIKRIIALKVVERRLTIKLGRGNPANANQAVVIPRRVVVVPYEEDDEEVSDDDYGHDAYGYDTPPSSEEGSDDDEADGAEDNNDEEMEDEGEQQQEEEQGEEMEQEEVPQAIDVVAQPELIDEDDDPALSDSSDAEPEWTLQEKLKLQQVLKKMSRRKKATELKNKRTNLLQMGKLLADAVKSKVTDINEQLNNVNQQSFKDVALPVDQSGEYDWAKVARAMNCNKTAEECRDLWQLYLHPCFDGHSSSTVEDRAAPNKRGQNREIDDDSSDEDS